MKNKTVVVSLIFFCMAFIMPLHADAFSVDSLWSRFVRPGDEARTKVWWFHGETAATREGITADLEAFRDKGVGGVVYYDQVHGKGDLASAVFSPEWWADLKFAASEARRLGLGFELNISNGYVAGGPWITPENAMRRITYDDTLITSDGKRDIVLPAVEMPHYEGIAVLAFPDDEIADTRLLKPEIRVNKSGVDAISLFDKKGGLQKITENGTVITLDFGRVFTARTFSYRTKGRGKAATCAIPTPCIPGSSFTGAGYVELPPIGDLEVSDDGIHYEKVCAIPPLYRSMGYKFDQITVAFPAASGRLFRISLHDWNVPGTAPSSLMFGNACLSASPTVDNWEVKAAFRPEFADYRQVPKISGDKGISFKKIRDISSSASADGTLRWQVPSGRWRIMRFGHVPTGAKTKHGRKGMSGLECDRMSAAAARLQWESFFKRVCDTLGLAGVKPDGLVMDSHEAGAQNWTAGFAAEFRRRRGYDIIPWLPVVSGRLVGSRSESDKVLYDFRRTIADLISDNFYSVIDSLCASAGGTFTAQAIGAALTIAGDNIQSKGRVVKPQGEFWAYQTTGGYDIKEASSAAHLYGRRIASAEAFTDATYRHSFAQLKSLADFAYSMGNNEFVVCASAYQPWLDRFPGSTANGRQYCLNRNNTLWPMSRPFWDYQARCADMLRQGDAAVTFCLYVGDDAPVKLLSHKLPAMPEGYDWDVFTTDALLTAMRADDKKVLTQSGTSYRMIIIENETFVSPAALFKIADMAVQGVPVCANRESLVRVAKMFGACDDDYEHVLNRLFSLPNVYPLSTVAASQEADIRNALAAEKISPQISLRSANTPTEKVYFSQRNTPEADIYFVYNRGTGVFRDSVSLGTAHRDIELWHPVDLTRTWLVADRKSQASNRVLLELQPEETVFIVASSGDAPQTVNTVAAHNEQPMTKVLTKPWTVTFDPKLGGPEKPVVFHELTDWTESADNSIRYYSGEAVYSTEVDIDSTFLAEPQATGSASRAVVFSRTVLCLPSVNAVARVIVNGTDAGTVWCSPWQTDITGLLRPGANEIKIVCANSIVNRVIGDASLPESERVTFSFPEFLKRTDRLQPSGIVGKVVIRKYGGR